jgi:hypothetical protein
MARRAKKANQAATELIVEVVVVGDEEALVDRLARFLIALAEATEESGE